MFGMKLSLTFFTFFHTRFAAYKNWKFEVLNISKSENGGIRVIFEFTIWLCLTRTGNY